MEAIAILGRDPETGDGVRLTVVDGRIAGIEPARVEENVFLSPGLVDLQVNGFGGLDLNEDGLRTETVMTLVRRLVATGVTTFAPTLITASQDSLLERLARIAEAADRDPLARACIAFVHMEGPAISPRDGFRGAHPLQHVRLPSTEEFAQWQQACGGRIGMVTLSPHYDGVEEYIAWLVAQGVHVALGHTDASDEQIIRAVRTGARIATHLGNGIAAEIPRHQNPIWSQLAQDELTASFIADGHHLPASVLRSMMRAKGLDRSMLVSDAVALAGMPPGEYESNIGGRVDLSEDGRLSIAGSSLLAGSAMPLIRCVERAVRMTGLSLAEVLRAATVVPGRFAGRGALAAGARADILRFRWDEANGTVAIEEVWVAGEKYSPRDNSCFDVLN